MKNIIKSALLLTSVVPVLTGCDSNNIKEFRADPNMRLEVPHASLGKVFVESVTMPHDDTNSIMCRAAGNIYLPERMTYSQYVAKAMKHSLSSIERLADSQKDGHSMSIVLTEVTFNSLAGEWHINADVKVDNNMPVKINTMTEYGTAYMAIVACKNTAEAFDTAVGNFIKKVLSNPEIVKQIK